MKPSWKLYKSELKEPTPAADRHNRSTKRLEMTGYWRMEAAKTKPDYPVAIWTDEARADDATIFQIGRKVLNTAANESEWDNFVQGGWLDCVAVEKADWDRAMETGFWPDGKPARQMSAEERLGIDVTSGHNQAPVEETLAEQIASMTAAAKTLKDKGVKTKEDADAATVLLERLRLLLKKAEDERVREKEPHLEAGRAVDAKWQTIRTPGIDAGKSLADARDLWLREEQRKLDEIARQETERRREEARRQAEEEANKRAQEAEERRKALAEQADAMGMEAQEEPEPEPEPVVEEVYVPEVKAETVRVGGAFSRSVSAKTKKVAVVKDAAALVGYLLEQKDADLQEYLAKRAEQARRAKVTLPGVEIKEV